MKFSAIIKGKADVRPVDLMLPGLAEPIKVGVRPLAAWDETDALERARAFAKAKGIDKPDNQDPIYVMGVWINTLAIACVVLEGEEKGEPFFADTTEILKELDRDRISYLFEAQQRVQEDHGCRKTKLTPDQFLAAVHECVTKGVDAEDLPFWKWQPSLLASFIHTLAVLLWNSHQDKSQFGGIFANGTMSETLRATSDA